MPDYFESCWEFVEGSSPSEIPTRSEFSDLYLDDSDHSVQFLTAELEKAAPRPPRTPRLLMISSGRMPSPCFVSNSSYGPLLFADKAKMTYRCTRDQSSSTIRESVHPQHRRAIGSSGVKTLDEQYSIAVV